MRFPGEPIHPFARWLAAGTSALVLLTAIFYFALDQGALSRTGFPQSSVSRETCLLCHRPSAPEYARLQGPHSPSRIGCASCHLGNPAEADQQKSHAGMVLIPGNMSSIRRTCGNSGCHDGTALRLETALMNTARGIVAVDRYAFGEADTPNGTTALKDVGQVSAADRHLRQLCSTCHLSNEKTAPGPVTELSRGGGCLACHLDTSPRRVVGKPLHAGLTLSPTQAHCFGCHSRSGRISTNYEGWHETLLSEEEAAGKPGYRLLQDGRIFRSVTADVHHEKGLACIDCHTSRETMGDGQEHYHQEEQVELACTDCHRVEPPKTLGWSELDPESQRIIRARAGKDLPERRSLVTAAKGLGLTNVYLNARGEPVLEGKISARIHPLKSPSPSCTRSLPGHERVSCQACHSAWAPRCVGCHTQAEQGGRWEEYPGDFLVTAPTLGVRKKAGFQESIEPFVPGMIMTIQFREAQGELSGKALAAARASGRFVRFFAPSVPHTTVARGRDCKSCHWDPVALGYGAGWLEYRSGQKSPVEFHAEYADLRDGLPADAWIGFLSKNREKGGAATRLDARAFDLAEQKKILQVGVCLRCHEGISGGSVSRIFNDFQASLVRRTPECEPGP